MLLEARRQDLSCHIPKSTVLSPGDQETRMRTDMRYGIVDPMMYPQPLVCPSPGENPTPADFVPSTNGLVDGLGEISSSKLASLILHEASISPKVDAFLLDSATHSKFSKDNLGTLTKDPQAAQKLFDGCVPLWFIREWDGKQIKSNVLAVVFPIQPHTLVCVQETTSPFPIIAFRPFGSTRGYEAIIHRSVDIVLCLDTLSTTLPANSK
ncbi:hypothetical protein CVT24_013248 [Panaeolus cyanescens]|uniref:Uncharacterized protein n=1 Tax=Panaeolus cyanescens TaxID=181874 RepID=A0A409YN20_9AGAR|nr:hypothetical protein CVT24_013248 [Panaeolus cyanescens]